MGVRNLFFWVCGIFFFLGVQNLFFLGVQNLFLGVRWVSKVRGEEGLIRVRDLSTLMNLEFPTVWMIVYFAWGEDTSPFVNFEFPAIWMNVYFGRAKWEHVSTGRVLFPY